VTARAWVSFALDVAAAALLLVALAVDRRESRRYPFPALVAASAWRWWGAALVASLAAWAAGCASTAPGAPPPVTPEQARFGCELGVCVAAAETREASRACRADVEARWQDFIAGRAAAPPPVLAGFRACVLEDAGAP
jgi:hypothetical protein